VKQEENQVNLLDLVPVQNMDWKKDEDGSIQLLKPKFRSALFRKHILPKMKRPYYRVKLDEKGSFLWSLIDGKRCVREIGVSFSKKFGAEAEPLYDRLAVFLQQLERSGFIIYKNL
jgi:hypothetical protein